MDISFSVQPKFFSVGLKLKHAREDERFVTLYNHRVEGIYNMMEALVWTELERIALAQQEACFCSLCKSDITAYALNRLPARYVSTQEGETRFKKLKMNERVYETVIEAVAHVSKHPHRANRMMTEHTINELFDSMDDLTKTE